MNAINEAAKVLRTAKVEDLPIISMVGNLDCPACSQEMTPEGFLPTYDELMKLRSWTVAQLVAFRRIQKNSGIDYRELLERTYSQDRPGIGALVNPTVLGVNDLNGIFVGIEPDGNAHS